MAFLKYWLWPNLVICEKYILILIISTKQPKIKYKKNSYLRKFLTDFRNLFFVLFLKSRRRSTNRNLTHFVHLKISYGQATTGCRWPRVGQTPSGCRSPPGVGHTPRYSEQAGGMHPTGMHACLKKLIKTRMHSSRIHPARMLPYGGHLPDYLTETPLDRDPSPLWTEWHTGVTTLPPPPRNFVVGGN